MSHQHHFLSRLDRLSPPQVETALSLYRDAKLVKWLLLRARLPDGAPRVALSLEDPARGPFLVVTRDGVFVTCLGLGMSPGDLPVVTRGQLDAHLAAAGDYRARVDTYLKIAGEVGGSGGVFGRLYDAADDLSREEMVALSALQPLYERQLLSLLFEATTHLETVRNTLLPILQRAPKLRPTESTRILLRDYWRSAFMVGHLSVLTGMSGPRLLENVPDALREMLVAAPLSWGAVRQGLLVLALRGVWLSARLGKAMLPVYKKILPGAGSKLTATDTTLALSAIAYRHSKLRAEIEKALHSAAQLPRETAVYLQPIATIAEATLKAEATESGALAAHQAAIGAEMVMKMTRALPKGSPFAFERSEDVPRDLALTIAVNATDSLITSGDGLPAAYMFLPWAARAAPEDLYLPRDFIRATREPWSPEGTYRILRPLADMYRNVAPRQEGPSRKGPCPCGSGRKYKRCCGEGKEAGAGGEGGGAEAPE